MIKIILGTLFLALTGCTSTLPPVSAIHGDYSLFGVKSMSVKMDCPNVKSDNVSVDSIPDFCNMLNSAVKVSIRSKSDIKITDNHPDLNINLKIEEIYGGNAQTRFWVGLGAGKSAITSYVYVIKEGKVLEEARIIETSTMPNLNSGTWSNEEMISQDITITSSRIADFILRPSSLTEQTSPPQR